MYFNFPYIFNILLASAVFADRRRENQYQPAERDSSTDTTITTGNMAGATLVGNNGSYFDIGGTFVVPNISGVVGSGIAIWVGIGNGDGCDNLVQTGVMLSVTENGTSGNAWIEWYPLPSEVTPDSEVSIFPGNTVRVGAGVSPDLSFGVFTFVNVDTNQSFAKIVKVPEGYSPCTKYAGWIVEDYVVGRAMVPFASFTPVTFTNAVAFNSGDREYGPQNAKSTFMVTSNGDKNVIIQAYVSSIDVDTVTIRRGSG